MNNNLQFALNPDIAQLQAYKSQSTSGQQVRAKLDAMENPYNLLQQVPQVADLGQLPVNFYPDPDASELRARLRSLLQLSSEQQLSLGNGSDELILNLSLLTARRGVLAFAPSFVMYKQAAQIVGAKYTQVDLHPDDFAINLGATLSAMRAERPGLIFISLPNNPTGNNFALDDIESICAAAEGLVVIDQAYRAFSSLDCEFLARKYPQVIMLGTFSKMGLAGLRLGFAYARQDIIEQLEKVRMPYNISSVNQLLALRLLEHYEQMLNNCQRVCQQRQWLYQELLKYPERWHCWPSATNFLTLRCQQRPAGQIHAELLKSGVLVKNLHASHPSLSNCLRLSIGSAEQNELLLSSLLAC